MPSTISDDRSPASPADALERLGLTLPTPLVPNASYVPVSALGELLHVSGQLPFDDDGAIPTRGRLGDDVDLETAQQLAQRCVLHLLAQVEAHLGSLTRVARVLKVHVYVASTPEFDRQHLVANGASDLLVEVFGAAGRHARSAFGVAALPFGSPVEVDAVLAAHAA